MTHDRTPRMTTEPYARPSIWAEETGQLESACPRSRGPGKRWSRIDFSRNVSSLHFLRVARGAILEQRGDLGEARLAVGDVALEGRARDAVRPA